MNLARFFERWGIAEDPFRAEEARQDSVFRRLGAQAGQVVAHPEFEKIAGEFDPPTTAIVFGEKGSGKTAIRMQVERRLNAHNRANPERRAYLIAYDDLNSVVDRLVSRAGRGGVAEAFASIRLADHMDGALRIGVTDVVDRLLAHRREPPEGEPFSTDKNTLRALDAGQRAGLLALQAVYDGSDRAVARTSALRRLLGIGGDRQAALWTVLAAISWALPAAVAYGWWRSGVGWESRPWMIALGSALALAILASVKRLVWDPGAMRLLARRALSGVRALSRTRESVAASLRLLPPSVRELAASHDADTEDRRFELFQRLRRILATLNCPNMLLVVDRVDEPTLVSGDTDRMRALVWPMLNNKFLQMDGVGVKLLLPVELRYALLRESTAFFQGARLDKQSLVERLSWSGTTLYDLCNARLQACLVSGAAPITLRELFEDDVSRHEIAEALDQMRRPRDAFKLLYRCVQEHCSSVSDEDPKWKIPRALLETVKKREQERVDQLARGVRPA